MIQSTMPLTPDEEQIIAILADLAIGSIDADTAAASLGLDLDGLTLLTETHPELVTQAAERAKTTQLDPDQTLATSQRGLAAIAATLTKRIHETPDALSVGEMVSAGSLLEKLTGMAEKRKAEIRAEVDPAKTNVSRTPVPLVITDLRGGKLHGMFLITPDDPKWVDTTDLKYQSPQFNWLDLYYPLNDAGVRLSIDELLGPHTRFMDDQGRIFGGAE